MRKTRKTLTAISTVTAAAALQCCLPAAVCGQTWLSNDQKQKLALTAATTPVVPDTTFFIAEGMPSLSFSQVYYSDSWNDGVNSMGFRAAFFGSTTHLRKRIFFRNSLDMAYARSKEGEATTSVKKEDRLNYNSVFGYRMVDVLPFYWVGQLDLKTQFDVGENAKGTEISRFFAPAYIIVSLGSRYQSELGLSMAVSPLSGRFTVVADTSYAKYVDIDLADNPRYFRTQIGAYCQLAYVSKMSKQFSIKTTLELFSNYLDSPQNIDVDWTTSASFSFNRFFSVIFFNRIIYRDKDRYTAKMGVDAAGNPLWVTKGPKLQWAESLNIGLAYRFATK
ncbi:MAG: DUF3078 domain-containing protein [Prevotellaceae bacterium]|jgi:hypothetical protein|nr:DUF3078 domain-containing protein [Prevotellaceae bacterium]